MAATVKYSRCLEKPHAQVVQVLEQALPHPGRLKLDFTVQFDFSYGKDTHSLDWVQLKVVVAVKRSQQSESASRYPNHHWHATL